MSTMQLDMSPNHPQKMAKHNKNLVYRYYREVWNHGNVAVIDQIFSANHTFYYTFDSPDLPSSGYQSIHQLAATVRSALPDLNLTVEDMVGQWNKVAVRFTIQGTHLGELLGFAPSGQAVTLSGMIIHHIANEEITDTWFSHNFLTEIQQSKSVLATA